MRRWAVIAVLFLLAVGAGIAVLLHLEKAPDDAALDLEAGAGPAPPPRAKAPGDGLPPPEPEPEPADDVPAPPGLPPPEPDPEPPSGPGIPVRGVLLDEDGRPVPGLTVTLVPPWPRGGSLPRPSDAFDFIRNQAGRQRWRSAVSGPAGRFEVRADEPGPHLVLAGPPRFQETWRTHTVPPEGEGPELKLVLHPGLAVSGKLVDEDTGAGLEDVRIVGTQPPPRRAAYKGTRIREDVTGPDGSFGLAGYGPGPVDLTILIPKERFYEMEGAPQRKVEAGDLSVVLKARGAGLVEFRAVEEGTNQPVVVPLRVRLAAPSPSRFTPAVWMEAPGVFVLRGYAQVEEYVLEMPGRAPVTIRIAVQNGRRVSHDEPVTFAAGGTVSGTVTWTGGDRIRGAYVYFRTLGEDDGAFRFVSVEADGRYRIDGLSGGSYRLVALAPGHRPAEERVTVEGSAVLRDFTLVLRQPGDPPVPASKPFAACREARVALAASNLPLPEVLDWIRFLTDADVRLREGADPGDGEIQITLQAEDLPLESALKLLTAMNGLTLDEETGEIYR